MEGRVAGRACFRFFPKLVRQRLMTLQKCNQSTPRESISVHIKGLWVMKNSKVWLCHLCSPKMKGFGHVLPVVNIRQAYSCTSWHGASASVSRSVKSKGEQSLGPAWFESQGGWCHDSRQFETRYDGTTCRRPLWPRYRHLRGWVYQLTPAGVGRG